MADNDIKTDATGPSLLDMADGYASYFKQSRSAHDPGQPNRDIRVIKGALEDALEIIEEYKNDPAKLENELESEFGRFGLKLDADSLANPTAAVIEAIQTPAFSRYHRISTMNGALETNFKGADSIEGVISNIQAQQDFAENFSGFTTDVNNMAKFLIENRDLIAQNPALANANFSTLAQDGDLKQTIEDAKFAPPTITIERMNALWSGGTEKIETLSRLNNSLESIKAGEAGEAILGMANKAYGLDLNDVRQLAPIMEAQEQLAASHFGGDSVKMAEFFAQNDLSGPVTQAPFQEFVSSGAAAAFIDASRTLSQKFENAAEEKPPADSPTTQLNVEENADIDSLSREEKEVLLAQQILQQQTETGTDINPDSETTSEPTIDPADTPAEELEETQNPDTPADTSATTEQETPEQIVDKAIEKAAIDSKSPIAGGTYTVVKGDALSLIVQTAYDTDAENPLSGTEIRALTELVSAHNGKENSDQIGINEKIKLPTQEDMIAMRDGTYKEPEDQEKLARDNNTPAFSADIPGLPAHG